MTATGGCSDSGHTMAQGMLSAATHAESVANSLPLRLTFNTNATSFVVTQLLQEDMTGSSCNIFNGPTMWLTAADDMSLRCSAHLTPRATRQTKCLVSVRVIEKTAWHQRFAEVCFSKCSCVAD